MKLAATLENELFSYFKHALRFGDTDNFIHFSSRLVAHVGCKFCERHTSCLMNNSVNFPRRQTFLLILCGAK